MKFSRNNYSHCTFKINIMKKMKTLITAWFLGSGIMVLTAQELKFPELDKSPMDAAYYPREAAFSNYMDVGERQPLKVKVLYCRPRTQGRDIFGALVPYGKDWRLGANEATEVTFYEPVDINGKVIDRGTYTMFAEVHPDLWIMKLSTQRFIAGSDNRDISKDILAVSVPATQVTEGRELFTIGFQQLDERHCNMVFEWDHTRAVLPIAFNPVLMAGEDASPLDLAQYPNDSRFHNYLKPEELEANAPKIRVVYGRPQMKGRNIFGEVVKFGEPWRMGANETTEITFFDKVSIGGKTISPGTYGIMAVVNEAQWEFVIHTNLPSWGTHRHDETTNVVRVKAPVEQTPSAVEALSILLDKRGDDRVDMIVAWDRSMARLPIILL
ncbi:MAG: hypothetical protein RLY31_1669 [Bacteroidota bacterium]|jgi:hypothetical protein